MTNVKNVLSVFLLSTLAAGLFLVVSVDSGSAMVPTYVNGVVAEDTTWVEAGSPYVFTGAVGIPESVTLTIEAGVLVELGSYSLQVNGTLLAEGTDAEKVIFSSKDDRTDGIVLIYGDPTCTFENVVLKNTSFYGQNSLSNAKLNLISCILEESNVNVWGTTTISNSYVNGVVNLRGDSILTESTFLWGIDVAGSGSQSTFVGTYTISGNNITSQPTAAVLTVGNSGTISGNTISGGYAGIRQADGTSSMSAVIENNLITNNQIGILIITEADDSTIRCNTITQNGVGIQNPSPKQTITGNNILDNSAYNIYASVSAISAANNWWGTTDRAAISQKIYDSNDDFSLGTVVFVPFLLEANSTSVKSMATSPLDSISYQTGGQASMTVLGGLELGVIATVAIVVLLVVVVVLRASRKSRR
ncbi:MAG TPA: NosD domain-containing protein [Candidatus Acidoferrales bacterium]|nr:NosD domain-containing protein [Candidatus Acidoferrales bacterium]